MTIVICPECSTDRKGMPYSQVVRLTGTTNHYLCRTCGNVFLIKKLKKREICSLTLGKTKCGNLTCVAKGCLNFTVRRKK